MRTRSLWPALVAIALATAATAPADTPPPTEVQKAFTRLKALEGSWEGRMTTNPPEAIVQDKLVQVSFRVASRGNVLMHDMKVEGIPDNPLTMLYAEGDALQLTHYCDAGNRPRMTGRMSPDGQTVEFDFLDLTGGNKHGHMHRARFTFVDEQRHIEEWVWMKPGDTPIHVHIEMRRKP